MKFTMRTITAVMLLGAILLAGGSLLPWITVPKKVLDNFQTEGLFTLLRTLTAITFFIGLIAIAAVLSGRKRNQRSHTLIALVASIIGIGILIFFFASMSGSIRKALDIHIGLGYIIAFSGGVMVLLGAGYALRK
jgi:hypothetical protein